MDSRFIVTPKNNDSKEETHVTMSLRLELKLQAGYDELAAKSGRSRNELMCRALRYALDHLEFVPEKGENQ